MRHRLNVLSSQMRKRGKRHVANEIWAHGNKQHPFYDTEM